LFCLIIIYNNITFLSLPHLTLFLTCIFISSQHDRCDQSRDRHRDCDSRDYCGGGNDRPCNLNQDGHDYRPPLHPGGMGHPGGFPGDFPRLYPSDQSLNPEKVSCDASNFALQSPIQELGIKAKIHDGVETCLRRPTVSACNLPLQDLTVTQTLSLKPEKVSCDASNDALQSPIQELGIKAKIHDGVETCLRHPIVSACNLPFTVKCKQCFTCTQCLMQESFSKRQWNKLMSRCLSCISIIKSTKNENIILQRDHSMSNGIVDGHKHQLSNKKRSDRAMRCSSEDQDKAKQGLQEFCRQFNVERQTVDDIAGLGFHTKSLQVFRRMTFIDPHEPVPNAHINDFLTTIRCHPVVHKPFSVLPSQSASDSRPMHTFSDSRRMTRGSDLKYCNKSVERNYITSFPQNRMYWHSNGTVLLNSTGILIGARCSRQITPDIGQELYVIYCEMEKHRSFLMRGKQVANVCANFVVTGLKEDNNTKLKMGHSPRSNSSALLETEMRSKIQYLNQHKVELYAHHVSGVTAGKLFWPRSHTDPDVWYTVLVCIDYGRGVQSGGDFAFASIGSVLKCKHCSVLIYNPTHHHGTTEFSLYP